MHGDNYGGFHKVGALGGVAVNAKFNSRTSIDIGFFFSQKGARHNPNPTKGDFAAYRLNLNYIDIPVLLRYQANPTYFITLGPSVAYLINYTEEINYINYTGAYPFNKFEYAANFGLGRKIKDKYCVEVRSSNSVTPIRGFGAFTNSVFFPNQAARFFNRGFYNIILTLMFSYNIDIKKKSETPQQP